MSDASCNSSDIGRSSSPVSELAESLGQSLKVSDDQPSQNGVGHDVEKQGSESSDVQGGTTDSSDIERGDMPPDSSSETSRKRFSKRDFSI